MDTKTKSLDMRIKLPQYCGLVPFEECLTVSFDSSLEATKTIFEFAEVTWIGALQLSLLFSWIHALRQNKTTVEFEFGEPLDGGVFKWLSQMGFIKEITSLGVNIDRKPESSPQRRLAAFQTFCEIDALLAYESTISNPESCRQLIGGGQDLELISSGDFREILLKELGENAFLHGDGRCVRYAVAEMPATNFVGKNNFLSSFTDPFIEFVISDEGDGLVSTLRSAIPEGWRPHDIEAKRQLSPGALCCAFSLEFSSTSDPSKRRSRLADILKAADSFAEAVPTGLFYVGSLVRHYGGELVFRTKKNCVAIDFTRDVATIRENPLGKQGSSINGTHILVRLPRTRRRVQQLSFTAHSKQFITQQRGQETQNNFKYICLAEIWKESNERPEAFLLAVEAATEKILLTSANKGRALLVLLADGLFADTKTISVLLMSLGTIPHRDWTIRLHGVRPEHFAAFSQQIARLGQLERDSKQTRFSSARWNSFTIVSSDLTSQLEFGPILTQRLDESELAWSAEEGLLRALQKLTTEAPVHHVEKKNRYYLIEGKYYTQRFFEIGKLVSTEYSPLGIELSTALIRLWIRKHNVGVICIISEPLHEFSHHLGKTIPEVHVITLSANQPIPFIKAQEKLDENKTLLLLTDVMCTGSQFKWFFKLAKAPNYLRIGAFVNGTPRKYLPTDGEEDSKNIPIISIYHKSIKPITDLTIERDYEVYTVDSRTHAPTSQQRLDDIQLNPEELLEFAAKGKALLHGHVIYEEKHYVDFVHIPRLMAEIQPSLEKSWERMIQQIEKSRFSLNEVTVFYLQEETGWEQIVAKFMSTKRVAECRSINRDKLLKPPLEGEELIQGRCLWFVLPVIATGETARRCLEFSSRCRSRKYLLDDSTSAPSVFISAIFARMPQPELSFYQNIRRYRAQDVWMDVLGFLDVPAYPSEQECPICSIRKLASRNAEQFDGYPKIREAVATCEKEIATTELVDTLVITELLDKYSSQTGAMARMMALFQAGKMGDVRSRKILAEILDHRDGRIMFINMIGEYCDKNLFPTSEVQKAIYRGYEPLQQDLISILESNSEWDELPISFWMGVFILFPHVLEQELTALIWSAGTKGKVAPLRRLVFTVLLDPVRFGQHIAIGAIIPSPPENVSKLLLEIQSFPYRFGREQGTAIEAFESVIWLLRRSTDWGSGIEAFRAEVHTKRESDIRSGWRRLEVSGVFRVLREIQRIKSADSGRGLWSAILAEGGDPEGCIEKIVNSATRLKNLCLIKIDADALEAELPELDAAGKALGGEIDRLVSSAYVARRKVLEQVDTETKWRVLREAVELNIVIAEDQPGVLFGLSDLVSTIIAILENAAVCMEGKISSSNQTVLDRPKLTITFGGFSADGRSSIMTVSDNIPYKKPLVPNGGLRQVEEYCRKYGAIFLPNIDCAQNNHVNMTFHFRIDNSRRDQQ